jgi:hypothetical protein
MPSHYLYQSLPNIHNATRNLELELSNVNDWMSNNVLEVYVEKSTAMLIARPNTLQETNEFQVSMNGWPIERVYQTKLLGALIDDHLSWLPQETIQA